MSNQAPGAADVPLLDLPTDRPRPAFLSHAPESISLRLEPPLAGRLRALACRHGAAPAQPLLAGFAAWLARLSDCDTPTVLFFNEHHGPTLARLDVSEHVSVSQLVGQACAPHAAAAGSGFGSQLALAWSRAGVPGHVQGGDLTLGACDDGAAIACTLWYAPELFDRPTIARYMRHWHTLLDAMSEDDARPAADLPLLGGEELGRILVRWNDTRTGFAGDKCVHEVFEIQAERDPGALAIVDGERRMTYAELNAQANRLARHLRASSVTAGARVAIALERSAALVVAQLAVLKCGAVYVPIDDEYPAERKQFMLDDAGVAVLLARSGQVFPQSWQGLRMDFDRLPMGQGGAENLPPQQGSEAAAYIMYTSGSTGQPKGVVVPHRAINRLVVNCGYARFEAADRVAFAANPAFDAATLEVWAPLLNGGCVVVIGREVLLDPRRLGASLRETGVTVLWLTVGLFNRFAESMSDAFAGLRYLIVGGDVLNPATIASVLRRAPPQHLVNGYGPTETTTFALAHEIKAVSPGLEPIPLGRPIANTQVYILDRRRRPVPVGVRGEIYIGGAGVALGYLNRPTLTAERFVSNPFDPASMGPAWNDSVLYRTGDLGKWRLDGTVDYLGRNDAQVKIRGFRVEPGEIEAQLAAHPAVREAVVLAREDRPGDKQLVAYVVLRGDDSRALDELRAAMAASMPGYMRPVAYVVMTALPLTPNGKPDRRALPAPAFDAFEANEYVPPVGETEAALARIWRELLGFERVGRHDHFFRLGGHSLHASRLIARVAEEFELELPLSCVFEHPTLSALAEVVLDAQLEQFDPEELATLLAQTPGPAS